MQLSPTNWEREKKQCEGVSPVWGWIDDVIIKSVINDVRQQDVRIYTLLYKHSIQIFPLEWIDSDKLSAAHTKIEQNKNMVNKIDTISLSLFEQWGKKKSRSKKL
jgi:hypothetical protein